jgi:hypothetical protein
MASLFAIAGMYLMVDDDQMTSLKDAIAAFLSVASTDFDILRCYSGIPGQEETMMCIEIQDVSTGDKSIIHLDSSDVFSLPA